MNNFKIARNFNLREFMCEDGSELVKVDERLVNKLQLLRDKIQLPIEVLSGYRTPKYNKEVGGVVNSQHLEGKAADIMVMGMRPDVLKAHAEEIGFNGIGLYPANSVRAGFVHVDVRDDFARWEG